MKSHSSDSSAKGNEDRREQLAMISVLTFPKLVTIIFEMQDKTERWMELCKQAAIEQDPKKLMELVAEINQLLEAKERRLGIIPPKE